MCESSERSELRETQSHRKGNRCVRRRRGMMLQGWRVGDRHRLRELKGMDEMWFDAYRACACECARLPDAGALAEGGSGCGVSSSVLQTRQRWRTLTCAEMENPSTFKNGVDQSAWLPPHPLMHYCLGLGTASLPLVHHFSHFLSLFFDSQHVRVL